MIPFKVTTLNGKDYIEVYNKFQNLGFTNVEKKPIKDLVFGWLVKDGSIEKVTIGGEQNNKKNKAFPFDIEIIIEYHTFRKS